MPNRMEEMWAVLDLLAPGHLGDKTGFNEYYAKPIRRGRSSTAKSWEMQRVIPTAAPVPFLSFLKKMLLCCLCAGASCCQPKLTRQLPLGLPSVMMCCDM
jgi:hypothetical protein